MRWCWSRRAISRDVEKFLRNIQIFRLLRKCPVGLFCFFCFIASLFLPGECFHTRPVMAAVDLVPRAGASFDFLYIDANVGGSSGGHTGIRIDNRVYHFQYYADGLFRLVRDRWPHFEYIYNDLENRTISIAAIEVSSGDLSRIKDHFNRYYLIQEAHVNRLEILRADMKLLDDLSRGRYRMALKGAGLFSWKGRSNSAGMELRAAVTEQFGVHFLAEKMRSLNTEFVKIPLTVCYPVNFEVSKDYYPGPFSSPALDYAENRLKYAAILVLEKSLPVTQVELMDMEGFSRSFKKSGLSLNEKKMLAAYGEELKQSVVSLVNSPRPDWGYPLLLAAARFHAVRLSLSKNRLILLDPFPEEASTVPETRVQGDPEVTAALADRAYKKYRRIRKAVFENPLDEKNYNRLEESAGRYAELEKGRVAGKPVRVAYGRLIPSREGVVALPESSVSEMTLARSRYAADAGLARYSEQMKRCYPYHLIDNNCATELMRTLNTSFETKNETIRALGGYIEPNECWDFVPFYLYSRVKQKLRVIKTTVRPGFRKRQLALMEEKDSTGEGVIYLRECNTLTSTLYKGTSGDTPFLFFTDDVIWIRPVYGAFNLVYGMLAAGAGIFTVPEDNGKRAVQGLKGALYSLPELLFFNIRKGSFDYVNEGVKGEVDQMEKSAPAFDRRVSP